jgi:hypothetical protein
MRNPYNPRDKAYAMDEISFHASLYALLTAVKTLEETNDLSPESTPLQPVEIGQKRLSQ